MQIYTRETVSLQQMMEFLNCIQLEERIGLSM